MQEFEEDIWFLSRVGGDPVSPEINLGDEGGDWGGGVFSP